jgi:hypothetical protein
MQQSAKSASAVGGFAGSLINDKMGRKIVGGALRTPLRGLYRGGQEAARQVDRRLGAQVGASSFTAAAAGAMGADYAKLASKVPLMGPALGRATADLTGRIQAPIEAQVAKEQKAAKERVSHYTDDQLADHYRLLAEGKTSAIGLGTKDDLDAMAVRFSTDGGFRKKIKDKISKEQYQKLLRTSHARVNSKKDALLDDKGKEGFNKFLSQNPDVLIERDEKGEYKKNADGKVDTSKMDEFIDSEKFTPRELSEAAAGNEYVLASLKAKVVRVGKGGKEITAYDDVLRGIHGQKLKKAAEKSGAQPRDIGDEDETPADSKAQVAATAAVVSAAGVERSFTQTRPKRGNGGGSSGGGGTPPAGGTPPVVPPTTPPPTTPPNNGGSSASASAAPVSPERARLLREREERIKAAAPEPLVSFDNPPVLPNAPGSTPIRVRPPRAPRGARNVPPPPGNPGPDQPSA